MTVKEFAEQWRPNGVNVVLDEVSLSFADAWAQVVLGNYLLQEGANKYQLGESLLTPPEEEKSRIIQ